MPGPDPILCKEYQELARKHLRGLAALFSAVTGLFPHVAWARKWSPRWQVRYLPTGSRLCLEAQAGLACNLVPCHGCTAKHLAPALKSGHKGHCFRCSLGVCNYWVPIIVRSCMIGLAILQALVLPASGASLSRKASYLNRAPAMRIGKRPSRHAYGAGQSLTRSAFGEAAKLLHLVIEHVETSAEAELRKSDLAHTQRALVELQVAATRLRRELNGLVPAFNKTAPLLESENHTNRVVHAVVEYIHQHYSRPFTLQQCARGIHLNAAYLSAQFSRVVGVPFKTYLTELRIEGARELLSNPAVTIAEVAFSVGYASENRFRHAFKRVTGLSPRLWRETLRMDPRGKS